MDELKYRVMFKDGSYGRWYCREVETLGEVLKLRLSLDAPGQILTVQFCAPEEKHCSQCELAVEDLGLCFEHLNEELDRYHETELHDAWPDFHDEPNLPGLRDVY